MNGLIGWVGEEDGGVELGTCMIVRSEGGWR